MTKSVQLKLKLGNLINQKHGLSDDEKRKLKIKITERIRKNATKPIKLYIDRELNYYVEVEYMYGGMYRVFKNDGRTKVPLNVYNPLEDVIEIISRTKMEYKRRS